MPAVDPLLQPLPRLRPVDDALFWRCAAACQVASRNYGLSVVESAVLEGLMAHHHAGQPVADALARAAVAIIERLTKRREAGQSDAEIARRLRAMRRGRWTRRLPAIGQGVAPSTQAQAT